MKWIKNMKIGLRLKLSFGILSLLIIAVGFYGIVNTKKINEYNESIYMYDLVGVKDITEIKSNILHINMKMLQIMNENDKVSAVYLQKEINDLKNNDDVLIKEYKAAVSSKENPQKLEQFMLLLNTYRNDRKEILDLINKDKYAEASTYYPKLETINTQIVSFLDDYVKFNVNRAKTEYDKSNETYRKTILLSALLVFIFVGFAAFVSFGTSSFIAKRVGKLLKFAEDLGGGNLDSNIEIDSREELGLLSIALNKAANARKDYEMELSANFEELESSYEEISALEEELREKYNELSESEKNLEYLAYHDFLTDLPNRQYLYERIQSDLNKEELEGALLFLDLDNFKYINDTLGHDFGDKLIQAVGERLKGLRDINTYLVRIGGDEFIIVVRNLSSMEQLESFAKNLLYILNDPFEISGNSIKITSSIGIAKYPEHGASVDELLKKADIAMYYSKRYRKNRYTIFKEDMNKELIDRMAIEKNLRNALDGNEFLLYYQPQVDTNTEVVTSFEALIRWNNPELGFVSPADFISIAEESEMIVDIGNWVMKSACDFARDIIDNGSDNVYISVNVSVLQFLQTDFVDNVLNILKQSDLPAEFLELEITETIYMENYEMIHNKLTELRSKGVKIALDDFGKGYSSLSYLRRLPIDTLKLDKSFIDDICIDTEASLVENIIKMGQKMELSIIAEGVETQEQYLHLRNFGCDKIQGYYFSRPLTEENAKKLLVEK